jgi:hypothetical protein
LFVNCRTWASFEPLGTGGLGVVGALGVLVWLGLGVGFGVRVARRLGAVVDRVGVGVALGFFAGAGVALGVALGVATGALASSTGVVDPASVTTVRGARCPVAATSFPPWVIYQALAATTLSTATAPTIGAVIPRRGRRLSRVMSTDRSGSRRRPRPFTRNRTPALTNL